MKVFLGIYTKVLLDTLSIELKEKGIDVLLLSEGDCVPSNSTTVLECAFAEKVNFPDTGDFSNIIIIGYPNELETLEIDNYHRKLERPFLISDFFSLISENADEEKRPVTVKLMDKISVDLKNRTVSLEGKSVKLSKRLMELFMYLYSHHDQICSREEIFKEVWKDKAEDMYCVDTYVCYLRNKISSSLGYPEIKNLRNKGYIMQ